MEQVSPHVFVDPRDGPCTVGAIKTGEGVLLIDSPHQPTRARRWVEEVKTLGEVRYLLNTEYHADHTFGNAFLPGVVIAHRQVKDVFWDDSALGPNPLKDPKGFIERFDPDAVGAATTYKAREPEVTFDGRLTLYLGEVVIEAFPMNGHVPNDTAVYIEEERVLFSGDNVFNDVMTWHHDALPYEWLETLDHFKTMDIEVVIPGHGKPAGPEVFDKMKQVVQDALGTIGSALDEGMGKDEAVERITFIDRQPVPIEFESMAADLQKIFVARLYDQVQARRS